MENFVAGFIIVGSFILIGGGLYFASSGKFLRWLFHDICKFHIVTDDEQSWFDGCSMHSHCHICKKEVMLDCDGNWF